MGQYYHPVSVNKKEHVYSHDYGSGLKLMEHSYIENEFVKVVEGFLTPGGHWHKDSIVWAGDYANGEGDTDETPDDLAHPNLYSVCDVKIMGNPDGFDRKTFHYLVNHTKKQFVDYDHLLGPAEEAEDEPFLKKEEYVINPLPLLTCEGNGRGGGDFHKTDERVGMWARDSISIEAVAPEGYEQINGAFYE